MERFPARTSNGDDDVGEPLGNGMIFHNVRKLRQAFHVSQVLGHLGAFVTESGAQVHRVSLEVREAGENAVPANPPPKVLIRLQARDSGEFYAFGQQRRQKKKYRHRGVAWTIVWDESKVQ